MRTRFRVGPAGRLAMTVDYEIRSCRTGEVIGRCSGPNKIGACGQVEIGQSVACAGCNLCLLSGPSTAVPIPLSMTLCPVTLAAALGVELS